ncbi:AI-2E family transporter [Patescibacteria group bacterium]|nr:AI-2E family transporter [Patescibacteria group bacterium]
MKQRDILDISTASILRIVIVLLAIGFLYFIRDIIAIVFVSIIIAAALSPTVDRLTKWKLPRTISIILIYLLVLSLLGGIIYFVLPPMITQVRQLADSLPAYFTTFTDLLQNLQRGSISGLLNASQDSLNSLSNFLGQIANNVFNTTLGFFSGAAAIVMVFILTLYFLLDENGIKKFFVSLFPIKQKGQLITIANKMGTKLGGWLRGQIILAIAVGLVVYIGMLIIGMPYALTLGILAGVLEIIPVIGPIIAAIPAILIAFTISPTMALIVTIFYILVQELENKLLVPKVMQYAVGLNPVTIIIIILIGAKLMGVLGILLAIPVASVIYVLLEEWPKLADSKK